MSLSAFLDPLGKVHVLSERQEAYVRNRVDGMKPLDAARGAGYRDIGTSAIRVLAARMERNGYIQQAIARTRQAICDVSLERLKQRKRVSLFALELLEGDPRLTDADRKKVRDSLTMARVEEAASALAAFAREVADGKREKARRAQRGVRYRRGKGRARTENEDIA